MPLADGEVLGSIAGVTQSVIIAHESGHRPPAVPTHAAKVDAAGYDLVMGVRPQPGACSNCPAQWAAGCAAAMT